MTMLRPHEKELLQLYRSDASIETMERYIRTVCLHEYILGETSILLSRFNVQWHLPMNIGKYPESIQGVLKIMPNKSKSTKKKLGDWNGFANYRLSGSEKEAFTSWYAKSQDVIMDFLEEIVEGGYAVKISYSPDSDTYLTSLSCYNDVSPNFKYTMTSRHKTPLKSLGVAIYKHRILDGEWPVEGSESATWG